MDKVESLAIAERVAEFLRQKKGRRIVVLDLHQLTLIADYFVIAGGGSTTQVKALADYAQEQLEKARIPVLHTEGYDSARWVLIDCGGVVVHIFHQDERDFYNLERLWGDAPVVKIIDEA